VARVDRDVLQRLRALDFVTLKREVGKYLVDRDIRTLLQRRDAIVTRIDKLGEASLFNRRIPSTGCLLGDTK
jgi:hypothetical protein